MAESKYYVSPSEQDEYEEVIEFIKERDYIGKCKKIFKFDEYQYFVLDLLDKHRNY